MSGKSTLKALNESEIPTGDYCYTWEEVPSQANGFKGTTKTCPYYTIKTLNGVDVPWCLFLKCGGLNNGHEDEEITKLIEHFGSEDKMNEELPLFLLWDQVKECGINIDDQEGVL